jgi:hypothetical protein
MTVISIDYTLTSNNKLKPKTIKTKLSNEELNKYNFLDNFLTETQKKAKI